MAPRVRNSGSSTRTTRVPRMLPPGSVPARSAVSVTRTPSRGCRPDPGPAVAAMRAPYDEGHRSAPQRTVVPPRVTGGSRLIRRVWCIQFTVCDAFDMDAGRFDRETGHGPDGGRHDAVSAP